MSLLTAFVLFWGVYSLHGVAKATTTVDQVARKAPATGKLQPGDRLVAVDGRGGSFTTLRDRINAHRCAGTASAKCVAATPAQLTVIRGGARITLSLRPRYDATQKRMLLGFSPKANVVRERFLQGAGDAVSTGWTITHETVTAIGGIFVSAEKRKQVNSVVGAYEVTRQQFEFSVVQAIFLLGVISLSLGVINLFPFLPLDGGHIFWALAEKLRGRAIPFAVMERASVIGIVLVLFVFLVGFTNDIDRITGRGFGVP
jgi:regulator of sigma E protease